MVYEGVAYKNERQKISIFIEKKDAVTEEKLEGVIFGLYAREDILSQQGEVLVEKDTLLEKKATDENGQLTFDSDLYHGKYYVKEEVRKPGYLSNEEIWEIDASYTDQNLAEIQLTKEVENQPTESQFTKTDATTGKNWKEPSCRSSIKRATLWKSGSVRKNRTWYMDCQRELIRSMKNCRLMQRAMYLRKISSLK